MIFGVIVGAFAILPAIVGYLSGPVGGRYLGYQFFVDDYMVYAAWMRQAADGHLLFDNRFAIESQPGLTFHLYFLVLGWLSKIIGIGAAETLARFVLSIVVIRLLARLLLKTRLDIFTCKLSIGLTTFGGGLGFLMWEDFGQVITHPRLPVIVQMTGGRLPTDVIQPESFLFPSMLTNSLFLASLSLILFTFLCVLNAQDTKTALWPGMVAFGVLMVIHSYDVLLVAMVLVALCVTSWQAQQLTSVWVGRVALICLGAVPAALWFLHVLKSDAVFQARSATDTPTGTFKQILVGIFPALVLGTYALGLNPDKKRWGALATYAWVLGLLILFALSGQHETGYWMGPLAFGVCLAAAIVLAALHKADDTALNLIICWAIIAVIAPYFPALFQRKLGMAMMVPWAILASLGTALIISRLERNARNLVASLVILVFSASSILWIARESRLRDRNIAETTVHTPYLSRDLTAILDLISQESSNRTVVLALPGIASPNQDGTFSSPYLPDLNCIVSGLTGAYTYAGHWSESPNYLAKRTKLTKFFLGKLNAAEKTALMTETKANFIISPQKSTFPDLPIDDMTQYGQVVYDGTQFQLIRVR